MGGIKWERLASMVICAAGGAVLLWLAGRFLLPILLPFLLGWGIAACLRPLAGRLSRLLHLPSGLCATVLLVCTLLALILLIGAAASRLLRDLQGVLSRLLESDLFSSETGSFDLFRAVSEGLGLSAKTAGGERYAVLRERFNAMVGDALGGMVSALSAELPHAAGRMISAMPSVLLFMAITVITGFYFCVDRGNLSRAVTLLLPSRFRAQLPSWRMQLKRFSWKYARAYLLLLLFTLVTLFLGFCLLRVEYALLLALITAAVDLLPVLGTGAVLVPWAAVELIRRNYAMGIGLLVLYLAVSVLRQILEPRLVGRSIGLHPLLTLAAGYAGWRLLGVLGMVLGPLLAVLVRNLCAPYVGSLKGE